MRSTVSSAVALGLGISVIVGCTHVQLQKDTVQQARTLSDIYQQQVLDNLAKFVYDFNSLATLFHCRWWDQRCQRSTIGSGSLLLPTGINSVSALTANDSTRCLDIDSHQRPTQT